MATTNEINSNNELIAKLDENFFLELITRVSSGESLAVICRERKVDFAAAMSWINGDDELQSRYAKALTIRDEHAKDEIISDLFGALRADITGVFDENNELLPLREMPQNVRKLIKGYDAKELYSGGKESHQIGMLHKVTFADRQRSLETFMKHLGMLDNKTTIDVGKSLGDLLMNDVTTGIKNDNDIKDERDRAEVKREDEYGQ